MKNSSNEVNTTDTKSRWQAMRDGAWEVGILAERQLMALGVLKPDQCKFVPRKQRRNDVYTTRFDNRD